MVSFPAKISQQSQFIESCKTGFRTSLMQQIMSKLGWIVVVAFEVLGGLAVDDCERRRSLKEQHPLVVPLQTGVDRTTKPRPTGNPPETPRRVSQRKWCMDHVTPRLPQWMCASQLQQFSLLHFHEPFPPRDYRLITNLPWWTVGDLKPAVVNGNWDPSQDLRHRYPGYLWSHKIWHPIEVWIIRV